MKKILILLLTVFLFGCSCKENTNDTILSIPSKKTQLDNDVLSSPINAYNLDKYLFREDVQYVDLRKGEMILEEGYVAGFEFVPFYEIIAAFRGNETLYTMASSYDNDGKIIPSGQIGGFRANFEESKSIIESIFRKDKYIFLISQGGSEGGYVINLLIQLGYDGNLLYNVGGVSNNEGVDSYKSIKTNKYFVQPQGGFNVSVNYDFIDELTPTQNNN